MSRLALVAVPLGLVVAAACALPWYLGLRTEQALRAEMGKLTSRAQFPLNVTFMRYDRGWLSSSALTRLTLKAQPSVFLDVRHEISHLPQPRTGWAHVRSVPQWSSDMQALLDHYFSGRPALTVDSVFAFDGGRKIAFSSPAFDRPLQAAPGAKLSWGGMQGTLSVGTDEQLVASALAPYLRLQGEDTQAGLKALTVDVSWQMRGAAADWQGETKVALGELHFSGPRDQVAMHDLSGAAYQRSNGESLLLGYALRVAGGTSTKAGEPQNSFSNAVLDLEFDQISKKALSKYLDAMRASEQAASTPHSALTSQTLVDLGAELLRGSPVIRLKKLGLETPSGAVSAQATVTFDGSNLAEMGLSPELLSRLRAKGNLEVAANLLRAQLQRAMRPQAEIVLGQQGAQNTEDNIRALSEKLGDAQLKNLTDSGILKSSGTNLRVEAELDAGQFLVNGQPAVRLFGAILTPPAQQAPRSAHPQVQAAGIPPRPLLLVGRGAPPMAEDAH